jgi:hypothetical protein
MGNGEEATVVGPTYPTCQTLYSRVWPEPGWEWEMLRVWVGHLSDNQCVGGNEKCHGCGTTSQTLYDQGIGMGMAESEMTAYPLLS